MTESQPISASVFTYNSAFVCFVSGAKCHRLPSVSVTRSQNFTKQISFEFTLTFKKMIYSKNTTTLLQRPK